MWLATAHSHNIDSWLSSQLINKLQLWISNSSQSLIAQYEDCDQQILLYNYALCVFAEQLYFFIIVFRNISQSKCSDLHISSINFCLRICSINIAQIGASKVQTITHIFYHLPLKVMFHEKICKIDNCNLQNVSVRFFFSCEVLTSYLAICKSIKSMEGYHTGISCQNSFHSISTPPWRVSWVSRNVEKLKKL